jgi:hypothetical protein
MSNSPSSSGYELLCIRGQPHGLYFGEAHFRAPSGSICAVAVYRYHGQIVFGALHDPEALSPGNLLHKTQIAMREALRAACPEIFNDDVSDPERRAAP